MAYWNRRLDVDLGTGEITTEHLSDEFARTYLGGAGFTTRVLYDEVPPGVDPLGPGNVLAVAPGLLVGPSVPTGSKTTFGFKSPLTGGYGKSLVGAKMGDQLKRAGYDLLTVRGAADSPSVLVIEDDDVRIEDAGDLWGMETREAEDALAERYGDVRTAVIGPAGEQESKIAMIECEDRQAGRGGPGAVMGSKHLKGIAVRGTKDVPVARPEELEELNERWRLETTGRGDIEITGTGDATVDVQYGTGEALDAKNTALGIFPTRNWQSSYFERAYERLEDPDERLDIDPRKWTGEYVDTKRPCPYCTKPCSQFFEAEDTEYGDVAVDGPEYETQYSLGGNLEIDDIEAVAKANELCDRLGLDTIDAGNAIAWAMEANEAGLLDEDRVDVDANLEFGNPDAMLEALRAMGRGEGELGRLLMDGHAAAAEKLGAGEEFAIHVKNMAPAGFEPRGIKGMGLAFGVAPRGADHLTSCLYALEMGGDFWEFEGYDRRRMDGKALALKAMEDLMMVYDMTGVCKFTRGLTLEEGVRDLINAMTGFDLSRSELLTAGERAYNLSRAINVREGFSREDDLLPERFAEPIPEGPSEGERIDPDAYERELDRYYVARGWTTDGVPMRETLNELDLDGVGERVGAANEIAAD